MRIARPLAAFALAIGSVAVLSATPAEAAITVTTTADEDNNDGDCSLREAVNSINSGSARDACGSTTGPITVPAGTYPIGTPLTISAAIVIQGAGAAATILDSSGIVGAQVFDANTAPSFTISGVTFQGGATYYVDAQCAAAPALTVTDSVLAGPGNYGVNNCNGSIVIERTTISGSGGYGVNNNGGSVSLTDTAVTDSERYGVNANSGSISLTRSTIARSGSYGVNANGGNVTLVNSTISGAEGYLINTNAGDISLSSSTVVGSAGRGVNSNDGTLAITNSVIADAETANCDVDSLSSGGFNVSDDDTCDFTEASDRGETDPELGALADNGGYTPTHLPTAGSPLIDSGGSCPDDDQRALPRPADGNEDGSAICDSGAVEIQPPAPPGTDGSAGTTSTTAAGSPAVVTPRFTG
jgi:CSLREA domain-containing protein